MIRPAWWSRDSLTPTECATMDRHEAETAREGEALRRRMDAERDRQDADHAPDPLDGPTDAQVALSRAGAGYWRDVERTRNL